mgnify:CR=1 FL=1
MGQTKVIRLALVVLSGLSKILRLHKASRGNKMIDPGVLSRTARKTLRQLPRWAGPVVLSGIRKIRAGQYYSLTLKKQPIVQVA